MDNPLVSILIPNYNKALYIRETLDSVIAQTYTNWECIIVDDHSTDNSWEILEGYAVKESRIKIYKRPENRRKGGNAARNFAFELSAGQYINWLDSDDIINDVFLEEKLKYLVKNHDLDYVLSDIYRFDRSVKECFRIYNCKISKSEFLDVGENKFSIQTSMPLFRVDFLNSLDLLYDENLYVLQDVEFHIRVLLKSMRFELIENSIVYWRILENSKSNVFSNKSLEKMYQDSFISYIVIYRNISLNYYLSYNQILFFKNVFNDFLIYLPIRKTCYWKTYIFVYKNNLFLNRMSSIKICLIKLAKTLRIIDT